MKLKTLSSGSHGNCYILISKTGEKLILDCGIDAKKIKKGLDFDVANVSGCVVSHHHLDHRKSAKDLERLGIPVMKPYETGETKARFGNFQIQAFELTDKNGNFCHTNADGSECSCYGFLIRHKEIGKFLYITDAAYVKWKFQGINHILLGVNYDSDLVDCNDSKRNHILRGHMNIDTACRFINANIGESLKSVVLCHLSADNADPEKFLERIESIAPAANVKIAESGEETKLERMEENTL